MPLLEAADVVDLAMQLEQNGEAFYRAVAKKTASGEIRSLFEDLADQEVQHYAVFAEMRQSARHKSLMSDDEWEWYLSYLNTTVDSALFQGPDKALAAAQDVTDEKEAIRMAIGFEKETLLFFHDLRELVSGDDRTFVTRIVDEEKRHIRRLAGML
jgi:rubrerythrin